MRDRVRVSGTESMQDHELLEYILFAFVPRRNTNEMAHALMERFGSFADVLNADAEELDKVQGMTGNAALFLSVLPENSGGTRRASRLRDLGFRARMR